MDSETGEERTFPNQKPEILAPGVDLWSCRDSDRDPPYAFSTGTSDSTVMVTGALALILSLHGEHIAGENGIIELHEMHLVKVALANSAQSDLSQLEAHHPKKGYGLLDAGEWSRQVEIEFGITQENT
jgi:subtilisin family serine protease